MSAEEKFYNILNLREGEEIIRVIRRYPLTLFFKILLAVVLILLPFFFMFLLFSWGVWGMAVFLAILIIGLLYAARLFVVWYYNTSIVTNYRVIDFDQQGFFDKTVSGITYDKIQEVFYRQKGVCQSLFKYGSVVLQIANTGTKIKLRHIYRPSEIQELILELQSDYRPPENEGIDVNGKRVEAAWDNIRGLSDDELVSIQAKIKDKFQQKEEAVREIFRRE